MASTTTWLPLLLFPLLLMSAILLLTHLKFPRFLFIPSSDGLLAVVLTFIHIVLAWTVAVTLVAILPLDIYTALSQGVSDSSWLSGMWATTYWASQFMCFLSIPFHQGYISSADFSAKNKAITSLRENGMFYGITAVAGVVGLVAMILMNKVTVGALPGLCIGLSNFFGLFAGIVLMAYGLVEVPRSVWRDADVSGHQKNVAKRLRHLQQSLDDSVTELRRSLCVVRAIDERTSSRDDARPLLESIAKDVEEMLPRRPVAREEDSAALDDEDLEQDDEASLAALRRRCRRACQSYERARAQYSRARSAARKAANRRASATGRDVMNEIVRPLVVRFAAILLAALSVSVVLAEATIATKRDPDLSVFSVLVHSAVESGGGAPAVQLLVLIPLAYICYCTNFTLFHLASFSFYHVVPGHTDAYSLLLTAALMCRFSAPLCYNFLNVLRIDKPTVFRHEMRSMEKMPIVGSDMFQNIFPAFLLVFVIAVFLNVHKRIKLRFWDFTDDDDYDGEGEETALLGASERTSADRQGDLEGADELEIEGGDGMWSSEPILRTRDSRYRRERERRRADRSGRV